MRYGINRRKCAIKQIAQKFNLSKQSIYATEKRALIKLHESEKLCGTAQCISGFYLNIDREECKCFGLSWAVYLAEQ